SPRGASLRRTRPSACTATACRACCSTPSTTRSTTAARPTSTSARWASSRRPSTNAESRAPPVASPGATPLLLVLRALQGPLLPRLLLGGGVGPARAGLPHRRAALHRPAPPQRPLGLDRAGGGGPHRRLPRQHRAAGGRHLLGPHARHQHRDRHAAPGVRPPAEAVVLLLRRAAHRPPGGAPHQGPRGDRRGGAPRPR